MCAFFFAENVSAVCVLRLCLVESSSACAFLFLYINKKWGYTIEKGKYCEREKIL